MTMTRTWAVLVRSLTCSAVVLPVAIPAQIGGDGSDGVFHPKVDAVIDTSARPLGFDYKSITIPLGVSVRLIGTHPAIFRSQGNVDIAGILSANGAQGAVNIAGQPGAGGYAGGAPQQNGKGPAGGKRGFPSGTGWYGKCGGHRGVYGSARPFDLRGGSGGGGYATTCSGSFTCAGSGGGGTVVILADGAIRVSGTIAVLGAPGTPGGCGASGSVMLRSLRQLTMSGQVDALLNHNYPNSTTGGYTRLDCYGALPTITGQVWPAATQLRLPTLDLRGSIQIGYFFELEALSVPGDDVVFYASLKGTIVPIPSLGTLFLDPATLAVLGVAKVPPGHDPRAFLRLLVPNNVALRGLQLFFQAINSTTKAHGPRLSNQARGRVQ